MESMKKILGTPRIVAGPHERGADLAAKSSMVDKE
jgi:hypothetical protein